MNISLFEAAAAMNANARWQETIADNLSMGHLTAHKKQSVSFQAIQAGTLPTHGMTPKGLGQKFSLPAPTVTTSFIQGELKPTDNPTDLGIDGPGFFTVELPDGTTAYTRNGEFKMDMNGKLITRHGCTVVGDRGPIQGNPASHEPIAVSPKGDVTQGARQLGKLQVVEFNNPQLLKSFGNSLFLGGDPGLQEQPATGATIYQGVVENSNASALMEMGDLITSMRLFEANQRVVQSQDERMGRAITELAGTN